MSCLFVIFALALRSVHADYGWTEDTEIVCNNINDTFTTPGTNCNGYYSCFNEIIIHQSCPPGLMFNPLLQRCQVSGDCYELVCYGRMDGVYPDATQGCRREYTCHGGRVTKVSSTTSNSDCPELSDSAARVITVENRCSSLPNGHYIDDDFCLGYFICDSGYELARFSCPQGHIFDGNQCSPNGRCHNICTGKEDGLHPDLGSQCAQYVLCKKGTVKYRKTCPAETIFNYDTCVPEATYSCNNPCKNRPDGYFPSSCKSYFQCKDYEYLGEKICSADQIFDGKQCISSERVKCSGPRQSSYCLGKNGWFTNSTDCRKFYHCAEDSTRIDYKCPAGQVFNGITCSSSSVCAKPSPDSCLDKPSGYYTQPKTSCQAFYYCYSNNKILFFCPYNHVFDGESCVHKARHECTL